MIFETFLLLLSYNDGVAMGRLKLQQEFQARNNNCSKLSEASSAAITDCTGYPDPAYAKGCQDGAQKAYSDLRWSTCSPTSNQCEKFGNDAADLIAAKRCNLIFVPVTTSKTQEDCYNAALAQCKGNLRAKLNALVTGQRCWLDSNRTQPRNQEFQIGDPDYLMDVASCDNAVGQIVGKPETSPDTFSGMFRIYDGAFISAGNDLWQQPAFIKTTECDRACAARSDCFGWTYQKVDGACFLKSWNANTGVIFAHPYWITGIR